VWVNAPGFAIRELRQTRGCVGTDAFVRPVQARSADVHEFKLENREGHEFTRATRATKTARLQPLGAAYARYQSSNYRAPVSALESGAVEKNCLYYGDNLTVLREHIKDESVDLIYLDPPFNSRQDYNVLFAERDGTRSAPQIMDAERA
jgi:hypothetical protein